jgi:hypothetical protein
MTDSLTVDRTGWAPLDDMAVGAHELGHAFAARESGLIPGQLKVNKWMGGGWCDIRDGNGQDYVTDETAWSFIVGLAAGKVGEQMWRERNGISWPWSWGTAGDDAMIADLLPQAGGRSVHQAQLEAAGLLEAVWDELDALIIPLATKGHLPGIDPV